MLKIFKKLFMSCEEVKNNTNVSTPRHIKYYKYKNGLMFVSSENKKQCYNSYSNTFKPITFDISDYNEITKEEYDVALHNSICDCEIGDGNNIQISTNPYSPKEIEKIINDKFDEWVVEYSGSKEEGDDVIYLGRNIWVKGYPFSIKSSKSNVNYRLNIEKPYKEACLNCGKCLDQINSTIKVFENKFKEINAELLKEKMIHDICSK